MKKKVTKKQNKQIVEIHIYVHQDNFNIGYAPSPTPTFAPQFSPCPICGRVGPHTCGSNPNITAINPPTHLI